ncbi:hypothetical protein E1I21_07785 [Microbacterium oleivorans]|uniref:hypothetical protein n=1 Tax=Microbacterium oleivorans TaxID=273677 RepID=UPI0010A2B5A3|nr:hypothetical protein [Microbacterium oleivorans]THE07365.1 hypothetical protein E1I21_07785 [Microbacterium oleivorans]
MTDPVDDLTRRATRNEPDDTTRIAARRLPDDETPDETLLAERHTDEGTRVTERRVPKDAAAPAIAHGRADTPRTASASGTRVPRAVYGPRHAEPSPPVVRTPVSPPRAHAAAADAPGGRSRRGGIVAVTLGGVLVVAGAVWGIIVIIQGGL